MSKVANRQTNRQTTTNEQRRLHILLGGGNNSRTVHTRKDHLRLDLLFNYQHCRQELCHILSV